MGSGFWNGPLLLTVFLESVLVLNLAGGETSHERLDFISGWGGPSPIGLVNQSEPFGFDLGGVRMPSAECRRRENYECYGRSGLVGRSSARMCNRPRPGGARDVPGPD